MKPVSQREKQIYKKCVFGRAKPEHKKAEAIKCLSLLPPIQVLVPEQTLS